MRLVTFPRVLGYGFNPVSFYFVRGREDVGGKLEYVVAEVVNTFREMKLYLIGDRGVDGFWRRRVAKDFYVSPFSDPGLSFDFSIGELGERWKVRIDDYEGEELVLKSAIEGKKWPMNGRMLVAFALKYPLLSVKIIGLIHWHALLLWLKRVPFFRKTERKEVQREVMRPHRSLNSQE